MRGLENDELAVLIGGVYLLLRVLLGLGRVLRCYVTDAMPTMSFGCYRLILTCFAGSLVSVGVFSIVSGGAPPGMWYAVYVSVAMMGWCLGASLEAILPVRLYRLSNWLATGRACEYAERLTDPELRIEAFTRLLLLGARARPARPRLLELFRDESVRYMAAHIVLATIPDPADDDPEVARAARPLLTDPELGVRVFAAAILVRFNAPVAEVFPTLCEGFAPNSGVIVVAAQALGRLGSAAEPAIPLLRDSAINPDVPNEEAVTALAKIGPAAVPALSEILEQGHDLSRYRAANALGDMGEAARPALLALRRAALKTSSIAGHAARESLKKLGHDIR